MESGGMGADPCLGMLAPSIERELSMYDGVRMVSGVRTVSLLQVRVPLISFVHRFSVVLAYVSEIVRVYVARCNTAASNFCRGVI